MKPAAKGEGSETASFLINGCIEREGDRGGRVLGRRVGGRQPGAIRLARNRLWQRLDPLRAGPREPAGVVLMRPNWSRGVKYFARYRAGWLRDRVPSSVG